MKVTKTMKEKVGHLGGGKGFGVGGTTNVGVEGVEDIGLEVDVEGIKDGVDRKGDVGVEIGAVGAIERVEGFEFAGET